MSDLSLLHSYRSDHHDIIRDFYVPCLSRSSLYSRAVGFFSSSALTVAAKGLHSFIQRGGQMRLVASPMLSEVDVEAIKKGYAIRQERETEALLAALEGDFGSLVRERLGLLAWMIGHNLLEIKIAVLRAPRGRGLYHEKFGLFSDGHSLVAFTGSPNESASGLISNFESIDVFCSWVPHDRDRASEKNDSFSRLWNDRTPTLRVYPFPEAARRSLLRFKPPTTPTRDPEQGNESPTADEARVSHPCMPGGITLRPYQEEAISNWLKARGRGTLKMATGSGKTIVALSIVERLYRDIDLSAVIILVPYRHLVLQWSRECERFGLQPIQCFQTRDEWCDKLQTELLRVNGAGGPGFLAAIVTNATFSSDAFQGVLPYFPDKTVLVADEVHNLGGHRLAQLLPVGIGLRLGLSATPERWFDEHGTQTLFDYFGPVLKPEFTLRDAIRARALVPYSYHPVFVELTGSEADEYLKLSRQIGKLLACNPDEHGDSPVLTALLARRARLIATAENKLHALRQIMATRLDTGHTLFYCGDGSVEDRTSGESHRHAELVCQVLGAELGYRVETYTAETPTDRREDLRARLVSGDLQGLVAIRCLDEGADIPLIRTAFILASSTNPRQFIQRRGRVLRPYPGKDRAEIFDFITVPPENLTEEHEVERRLLQRELQRYIEFADLALNSGEVRGTLVDLQAKFGLLHL
ncbi:MAG TPA: DEAD/DEAH box helicase family protein [Dissulfurispiraceae bacterium]|nr:DEAD/DEAH box helicase family protein [Dissulfurispiraceae bacterium]